ncbi:hypothetical protein D3C81_1909160 [compost metagenome]
MLVRGMIHYKVHHDLNVAFMGLMQHLIKVLHRSKLIHNASVITDVIAVIIVW